MTGEIKLIRSGRKSISVEVTRDCEVIVRAPYRMPKMDIEKFLADRTEWISKHLSEMRERMENSISSTPFSEEVLNEMKKSMQLKAYKRVEYFSRIMGLEYGRITVRPMVSRWGSCTSEKNLCFNTLLDLVPEYILDYVVVHELCHTVEMNHSRAFWGLVSRQIPDYAERRKWLRDNGSSIIARLKK